MLELLASEITPLSKAWGMTWNTMPSFTERIIMTLSKEREILESHQKNSLDRIEELVSIHKDVFVDLPPYELAALAHKITVNIKESSVLAKLEMEVGRAKRGEI